MEYVSVLAGGTFSDHPPGTDSTLATVARLVNDACTHAARQALVAFAPELAGTARVDAPTAAAIVLATLRSADRATGGTAVPRRLVHRAERRSARVTGTGPLAVLARHLDLLHRRGPAQRRLHLAVAVLRELQVSRRDEALHAVLAAALGAASSPGGAPGSSDDVALRSAGEAVRTASQPMP
jgi:hypothetical protein